jgi:NADPH2:quinone reductase
VLIQGASSAVGLMGLQIAKLMGAATVIGTSTDSARRERLAEFGPASPSTAPTRTGPDWRWRPMEAREST